LRSVGLVVHPLRDSAEVVEAVLGWVTGREITVFGLGRTTFYERARRRLRLTDFAEIPASRSDRARGTRRPGGLGVNLPSIPDS
jgi:hypothetical protein